MFRNLVAPENHSMVGEHGLPADVFMMAQTIWQVMSNQVKSSLIQKYFLQGHGLDGYDFEQVTNPANNRLRTTDQHAMLMFNASVLNLYDAAAMTEDFANRLSMFVCRGLQTNVSERPTMTDMRAELEGFWRESQPLEISAPEDLEQECHAVSWDDGRARHYSPALFEHDDEIGCDYVEMKDLGEME